MSDGPEIFNVVLGTAGHIDHGKSTLVQALTGIHPDRLKEEQDRGITIDLGFAPLELSNGLRVGIIDVPGHERFIKNMVAGASGIDFVMMVVAADDGVMAQTREHLQIVQLLGVRDGVTVITKKDLVEPEYLELVRDDIAKLVQGTVLEGKPILAVSSRSGEGLPELRRHLDAALSKLGRRPSGGPFRMPIQRVFAKEGFGTVVTGVPLSGEVDIGDTLDVLPPGYSGRVKGLHAYKSVITHGRAGHSTAINLHGPDIDKKEVFRGMIAATPGVFRPGKIFTAHLTHLPGTPWPLKHRAPVRFHSGTAEIQGKVLLLEGEQLAPGTIGWIQILLEEPTVLAPGDRYILRHQSPMVTLGGGQIVDVVEEKRQRQSPEVVAELEKRLECLNRPVDFLAHLLGTADAPKALQELSSETGLLPRDVLELIASLTREGRAVVLKADALFTSPKRLEGLLKTVISCLYDFFKEHPALGAIERPELRRRVEMKLGEESAAHVDELINVLRQRSLVKTESNLVSLASRERKLEGQLAEQALKVEAAFQTGGLAPLSPAEIEAQLKIAPKTVKEIIKYLTDTGKIVEATPEIYFHQANYDKAKSEVSALLEQKKELTTSEIRQHLGMNRKYVVPLVELFDRRKLTVRIGDKRRLI